MFETVIHTMLHTDTTLGTILTGGVYGMNTIPREGINRNNTPSAYATTGLRKPLVIVKALPTVPFGGLKDASDQFRTIRETVQLWFEADGDGLYSVLKSASDRAYVLLDQKSLNVTKGWGKCAFAGEITGYDREQNSLRFIRTDYTITGYMEG